MATKPTAALALMSSNPGRFALMLTDQTMPGMSGFALAAEMARIRPDLPILMMTGYSPGLMAGRVKVAGIHQLLRKPISIHSLGTATGSSLT